VAEGRDRIGGEARALLENPEVGALYLGARQALA